MVTIQYHAPGEAGLYLDTHMHSSESYDNARVPENSPFAIIHKQEEQGLLKIITDHDNRTIVPGIEIPAMELTVRPRQMRNTDPSYHTMHINLYDISCGQEADAKALAQQGDVDALVDYLKTQEIPWQYNHPAWHEPWERLNRWQMYEMAKHAPVLELNASRPKYANDIACFLASDLGKGLSGGSDGHIGIHSVGRSYTLTPGNDFHKAWDHIVAGYATVVRYDATPKSIASDAKHLIRQSFQDERMNDHTFNPFAFLSEAIGQTKIPIPRCIRPMARSLLLLYGHYLGHFTARKTYIDPWNHSSKETLSKLKQAIMRSARSLQHR
ncbi:MAG: hypothetical protein ACQESG_06085 [Nanobdellota archaeon]